MTLLELQNKQASIKSLIEILNQLNSVINEQIQTKQITRGKKYFYLWPRQTGKTTMAINKYINDRTRTIYVCANSAVVGEIQRRIYSIVPNSTANLTNIMDVSSAIYLIEFQHRHKSTNYTKIILDEYMIYSASQKRKLHDLLTKYHDINFDIYIYSTADRMYDAIAYNIIKSYKKTGVDDSNYTINDFIWNDLFYNFITDADVKLYSMSVEFDDDEEVKAAYGDKYEIEFKNKWLTK